MRSCNSRQSVFSDSRPSPKQYDTNNGNIWQATFTSAAKGGTPNNSAHQLSISVAHSSSHTNLKFGQCYFSGNVVVILATQKQEMC